MRLPVNVEHRVCHRLPALGFDERVAANCTPALPGAAKIDDYYGRNHRQDLSFEDPQSRAALSLKLRATLFAERVLAPVQHAIRGSSESVSTRHTVAAPILMAMTARRDPGPSQRLSWKIF